MKPDYDPTAWRCVTALELLLVLFVGLKLTGNIDWSWWWVLAPLWAQFALPLAVVLLLLGIAFPIGWVRRKLALRRLPGTHLPPVKQQAWERN